MSTRRALLKLLAGRCTGSAWQELRRLRNHRLFPALVEILRKKPGAILQYDVEQTFFQLRHLGSKGGWPLQ